MKFRFAFTTVLILGTVVSCATYQSKMWQSRNLVKQGQLQEAIEQVKVLAEEPGRDQLVYLLDYGTLLQIQQNYKESTQVFLKADRLADELDYHSVSNVSMAALGSEEMIQYKGDYFEKILINAYLALNYLMLGQRDEALVEVRRVNEKITRIRLEGRRDFELNPFAHYLGGVIWEANHRYDDAFIAYQKSLELGLQHPFIFSDLLRTAKKSKRIDQYGKLLGKSADNQLWYNKKYGELIVIFQQGWGPEKHFSPHDARFPKLYPVGSQTQFAKINLSDGTEAQTQLIYDVESVAIKTLDADVGAMIARKMAATVAKEAVAHEVRKDNKAMGDFLWLIMKLSDRADLRQWSTLPKSIQMTRLWLPEGSYQIALQGMDHFLTPTADRMEKQFVIKANEKTFINWRALR